jgi:hypothetical protein
VIYQNTNLLVKTLSALFCIYPKNLKTSSNFGQKTKRGDKNCQLIPARNKQHDFSEENSKLNPLSERLLGSTICTQMNA